MKSTIKSLYYELILKLKKNSFIYALWNKLKISSPIHIYFYSILIGIISGLFAILFSSSLNYFQNLIFDNFINYNLPLPKGEEFHHQENEFQQINYISLFLFPAIGGFLSGLITYFFCPEAKGNGTDAIINSFHYKGGHISAKVPFFKAIATILTIGTGGSAGKEGPTMQIGAGIGSAIGNFLKAGDRAKRALMIAGVAGGLGSIFRAPLGGAFTAVEIVYKEDIESDTVVPAFLASVTAYLIAIKFSGDHSIFYIPHVRIHHIYELIIFIIFSLLSLGSGYIFTKIYNYLVSFFENLKIHELFKPLIGGIIVGFILIFFQELTGDGLGFLQTFILGNTPSENTSYLLISFSFLIFAFLKMITTSLTVASGGSGGLFTPSLFIGGTLGASLAYAIQYFFPQLEISVPTFILVGMSGFFAGVAHAPIAGMIMVCDMIGNYELLPALMIVSIISASFSKWSIYKGQLINRFHSPAHYWDMNLNILKKISVKDIKNKIRKIAVVEPHILVHDLEEKSLKIRATDFVVINTKGEYKGIFSLRNFHHTKETESIKNLLTVLDVSNSSIPPLKMNDNLSKALQIMRENEIDKIAIVDDNNLVLGYLRIGDIIDIYLNIAR